MGYKEALKSLKDDIEESIKRTQKRRNRDKAKATFLKMSGVLLAGVVTVLVGLQGDQFNQYLLRNIALVLSASITVISAFDAFFDHRALWTMKTVTFVRLHDLMREMNFAIAQSSPNDIAEDTLLGFKKRFKEILQDDLRDWVKLRSETEQLGGTSGEQLIGVKE
jgi:hypothetical protein